MSGTILTQLKWSLSRCFSSYLMEFDSLLLSSSWLPVKCDVEQCGARLFSRTETLTNQIEGHMLALLLRWLNVCFLILVSTRDPCWDRSLTCVVWKCPTSFILFCWWAVWKSRTVTHVSECALCLPTLCCASSHVYCATMVWISRCVFVKCYERLLNSHVIFFTWDGRVTKQYGCKYLM